MRLSKSLVKFFYDGEAEKTLLEVDFLLKSVWGKAAMSYLLLPFLCILLRLRLIPPSPPASSLPSS